MRAGGRTDSRKESNHMSWYGVLCRLSLVSLIHGVLGADDLMRNERKARFVTGSDLFDPQFLEEFGNSGNTHEAPEERSPLAPRSGPALLKAFGDRCIPSSDSSPTYKLCLFKNVTQKDSNNDVHVLGLWHSWIDKETMAYISGDLCPNGNKRNTTIHLECGKTNLQLSRVTEPKICQYDAILDLPIDCNLFTLSAYDYLPKSEDLHTLDADESTLLQQQLHHLKAENQRLRAEVSALSLEKKQRTSP